MKNILHIVFGFALLSSISVSAQSDTLNFETPKKLDGNLNSGSEESLPILSPDGKTLYFARTFHTSNKGGKDSGQDIWFSEKNGDVYSKAKNLDVLNNTKNNVVVGVAKFRPRLYLLNQFSGKKNKTTPGLSISNYNDSLGTWGNPVPLEIPGLDIKGAYYSAFVDQDEDLILWTLPGEVDSLGNDLFVSISNDDGATWSVPLPLGATINTDQDEISPFFDKENNLLFFAKNKPENEFDYDIFYAKKLGDSWTSWSEPVAADDLNSDKFDAYFMSTSQGDIYYSSNRNDSLSSIYYTKIYIPEPVDTTVEEVVEVPEDEPVLIIETEGGTSTDKNLNELTKEELLAETTRIRFVYFDFDKFNISKTYLDVLEDAAEILDKYPDVELRIEGHTDAVGTEEYNQVLSEKRALSAKENLLVIGVEPDRIKTVGYGKREPYATNFTEEGRAMNRRVELVFRQID